MDTQTIMKEKNIGVLSGGKDHDAIGPISRCDSLIINDLMYGVQPIWINGHTSLANQPFDFFRRKRTMVTLVPSVGVMGHITNDLWYTKYMVAWLFILTYMCVVHMDPWEK